MAPDPSVAERVYREIKTKLVSGGYQLRQRLDATALAGEFATSTTPVRESLVRLHSERLIAFRPAYGFYVSLWSHLELEDLYCWRGQLCALALRRPNEEALAAALAHTEEDYGLRVQNVLQALIAASDNELQRASFNADERLYQARQAELDVWPKAEGEWRKVEATLRQTVKKSRAQAIHAYHERRAENARKIRDRAVVRASGNGR